MQKKCSLIITTYNWPEALELSVRSVFTQTVMPSEIIIADDGSRTATKDLVEKLRKESPIPIKHAWHEDKGFRLSAIRNLAMAQAEEPYIIQIDGDIILHPRFIDDHLHMAEPGYFVTGSRVMLSQELSKKILDKHDASYSEIIMGSKNLFNHLHSRTLSRFLSRRYKTSRKNMYYVKGCNMAFWKKDILQVNGYDETFVGWGREDSEIAIRLMNCGIKKKFLKMGGIEYHIFHPESKRDREAENTRMLQASIDEMKMRCEVGIDQYLDK